MELTNKCLNEILTICTEAFEVSVYEVESRKRTRNVSDCRKAYSIIAKEILDVNLDDIGAYINKTGAAISAQISNQPADKIYSILLLQCKKSAQEKIKQKLNNE